jgi:hypothetical protein
MPRRLGLTLVAVLAGLALLTAAHAQVRFEGTRGAFPDTDEGPSKVGFDLRLDADGVVFVVVEKGTGAIPDAITGFNKIEVPQDALQRVRVVEAVHLCSELVELSGGVVLIHEDVTLNRVARDYIAALEDINLALTSDGWNAGCHTYVFRMPDAGSIRLVLTNVPGGVQAYLGR